MQRRHMSKVGVSEPRTAILTSHIMNVFLYLGRFEGNRITYQDVGQMDMYLQMYDKMKKGPGAA